MARLSDGRWPLRLRSFRFRLVFFSALTIMVTIAIFGMVVFTLFTSLEIGRIDRTLSVCLEDVVSFRQKAGRLPIQVWEGRSRGVVLQVYDQDMSLLFHLPPGLSAPMIPGDLLEAASDWKHPFTFDPAKSRSLPRLWWILPWNYLSHRNFWRASTTVTLLDEKEVFLVSMVPMVWLLESRQLLFWMIVIAGIAGMIVSIAVGRLLAARAIRPLKDINRALTEISISNMSIDPTLLGTGREIDEIVNHINNMLRKLDMSMKNLQQFTSDASHELRTPLAIMRGTVDVALLRERDPDYYIGKLQELIYNIEDMQNLVGALLELARLDDFKGLGLDTREPVDLLLIAEDAIANMETITQRRGQTVERVLHPAPTQGRDAMVLRLAYNLLENASKHSPPGSKIGVSTYIDHERNHAVIEIRDDGPGLDPEEISKCFDRFWRADFSRTTPGFGLGLPLVKRIAQIHNALIEVESGKGEGSLFRVRFPLDSEALKGYDFE